MKKLFIHISTFAGAILVAASGQAGEYTTAPQPAPSEVFGTGFYMGINLGANLYQDRGDTRFFTNAFGDTLTVDPKNDVGFTGGVKAGYVFGTGVVRPALEADLFYNGWKTGADSTLTVGGLTTMSSSSATINTGAFMSNFLLRFSCGQFQPYVGAGIGIYFAESAGFTFANFQTQGGASHADFAWQLMAGADYYFTPKVSFFTEYRYLNYTGSQIDFSTSRSLNQQLVSGGLRFHF